METYREQIIWAAAFYEGEGCITNQPSGYPVLTVSQVYEEPLLMLQSALGVGLISGPSVQKNPKAQPYYVYNIHGDERVQYAIAAMWPWLSKRRKERAAEVLLLARERSSRKTTLPEGHQRNRDGLHCSRGHEYSDENTHYDKDGKPHCRICSRERRKEARQGSKCKECDNLVSTMGLCSKHYENYQASLGNLCRIDKCERGSFTKGLCSLHYKQSRRDPNKIAPRLRTHCPQGHEYTEENTYVSPKGSRNCRICQREAGRKYLANKRKQ